MKILYVFPHPDDESFGPAPAVSRQLREGHEVYLLTLTRGGATRMRHELGLSEEQMGEVRYREMQCVERVLGLSGMTVLDLPDSGLKEIDPRRIETAVEDHVREVEPNVLVTYAVHGISGFHDHLVSHAAVKRVYCAMRDEGADYLRRLAFFTIDEDAVAANRGVHDLNFSKAEDIDCRVAVNEEDMQQFNRALDCYETYRKVIDKSGVRDNVGPEVCFEIFSEEHDPPLGDLCEM